MEKLRELRKQQNLTMREFGEKFGLAESTISLYETGKRDPENNLLIKFADYFNVSIDFLLGREDRFGNPYLKEKKALNERPYSELSENFIKEFEQYFSEDNFIKYNRLYKLMNQQQQLMIIGYIIAKLEQAGIRLNNFDF